MPTTGAKMTSPIRVIILFTNSAQNTGYTVTNSDLKTVTNELRTAMNNSDKIIFAGPKDDGSEGGIIVNKCNVTTIEVKSVYVD